MYESKKGKREIAKNFREKKKEITKLCRNEEAPRG